MPPALNKRIKKRKKKDKGIEANHESIHTFDMGGLYPQVLTENQAQELLSMHPDPQLESNTPLQYSSHSIKYPDRRGYRTVDKSFPNANGASSPSSSSDIRALNEFIVGPRTSPVSGKQPRDFFEDILQGNEFEYIYWSTVSTPPERLDFMRANTLYDQNCHAILLPTISNSGLNYTISFEEICGNGDGNSGFLQVLKSNHEQSLVNAQKLVEILAQCNNFTPEIIAHSLSQSLVFPKINREQSYEYFVNTLQHNTKSKKSNSRESKNNQNPSPIDTRMNEHDTRHWYYDERKSRGWYSANNAIEYSNYECAFPDPRNLHEIQEINQSLAFLNQVAQTERQFMIHPWRDSNDQSENDISKTHIQNNSYDSFHRSETGNRRNTSSGAHNRKRHNSTNTNLGRKSMPKEQLGKKKVGITPNGPSNSRKENIPNNKAMYFDNSKATSAANSMQNGKIGSPTDTIHINHNVENTPSEPISPMTERSVDEVTIQPSRYPPTGVAFQDWVPQVNDPYVA